MAQNIQDLTPVEIDEILAPMWAKQADKLFEIHNKQILISKRSELVQLVMEQALDHKLVREARIKTPADGIQLYRKLTMAHDELDWLQDELKVLELESLPYENEYVRRGGWNRVFLATSSKGHAHNGQNCSTCHHGESRTGFVWLTRYSGKSEEEIVADAGERACTTCYPSAPVNAKGTKMFTPDEEEAQKARQEREEAKVQRAAKTASKAITSPDGTPLKGRWDTIRTEREAQIQAVDAIKDALKLWESMVLEPLFEAHPGLDDADMFSKIDTRQQSEAYELSVRLVAAIAAKQGRDDKVVFAELKAKAEAKVKREKNEILKRVYSLMAGMDGYQAYAKAAKAQGLTPWNPNKK